MYDFITNFSKCMFNNYCMRPRCLKRQERRGLYFIKAQRPIGEVSSVSKYLYSQTKVITKSEWTLVFYCHLSNAIFILNILPATMEQSNSQLSTSSYINSLVPKQLRSMLKATRRMRTATESLLVYQLYDCVYSTLLPKRNFSFLSNVRFQESRSIFLNSIQFEHFP